MNNFTDQLSATGLWKYYGDKPVVQEVTFELRPGEVLGLLGPNGAGKTTTVGMLYGAVIPSKGEVRLGNYLLASAEREIRAHLGVVTQENNLDRDLSTLENLTHYAHHCGLSFRAGEERALALLRRFGIEEYRDFNPEALSGGLKRRLVLARALLNEPQIVLLDEPTVGFDPDARQDFWKIVNEVKGQGIGILLTTHYMEEAERLCDRLILLQHGRIVDQGTPAELISRIAGHEVIEIEGVAEEIIGAIAKATASWCCRFSSGFCLGLRADSSAQTWEQLVKLSPTRLARRRASLDDVFLILTGASL